LRQQNPPKAVIVFFNRDYYLAFISRHNAPRYETGRRAWLFSACNVSSFLFPEAVKKARGGFTMNMHQKAKFNFTGW